MASIPLRKLEKPFTALTDAGEGDICIANGQMTFKDNVITLKHYGTVIFQYGFDDHVFYIGGYSDSDRDQINSMFYLLGMSYKASRAGGTMHPIYFGGRDPWGRD